MVAKISAGKSLFGALAYNQEKVDDGKAKVLGANLICEPADGKFNIGDVMDDFNRWIPSHFRTKNPVFHVSLNPHPDDKLTNEQLADIGREYMEKLGYGDQPYLIFKHEDIDREHIHIVSLRVKSDGTKVKDSKEHERSKAITIELEHKYNLIPSEGQNQGELWMLSPVDASKGNLKKQIASVIEPLTSMYHFQTIGEYKALLSLYNIGIEELRGEAKEKPYRGLLYSTLDKEGNKVGKPLKSSIFSKTVGLDSLEERMTESSQKIKEGKIRDQTRKIVFEALVTAKDELQFRRKLQSSNIDLVLRRNDEGRIYGATFIDHNNRCVLNGSRLGKEFSANALNEKFSNKEYIDNTQSQTIQSADVPTINSPVNLESIGNMIDSLLDIPVFDNSANPDANNRQLKKKRKKNRRYGRQM
ncbi:relaxase/mobilization nuclease domain-containing protein [Dysgonomonas sp. GY75]|uniref:conjugal transfer protein MobB n=1 Tax=Dysgonomonas sp. GY75 TaxID=2780419 RepID=UPI001883E675|nr:conjugal transfer protein MobB [Dysgonomonas sp. GY75]MBF0647220.1 relaxase/mobilization nuclease domain-containing protein [Dysgonomonas sp. GY75]